jgi:MoaA/NifB/PqqE/SkfB family radical SAM enzyme
MCGDPMLQGLAPRVLGILLTSKCNIACRHCCNHSHPTETRTLDLAALERLIDEATAIASITDIGFSGGEPLIKPDVLLPGIKYAASRGYQVSVTTNGFWGRSTGAPSMLQKLRDAGLSTLWISTSKFHREFVALETFAAAVRAGLAAGLEVNVNVVASGDCGRDSVRTVLGTDSDRVRMTVMPCLPVGRGADALLPGEWEQAEPEPLGNCRHHFSKLAVDLDGGVWPCCSPGGFTEPLRLGSRRGGPLGSIVAQGRRNPLMAVLEEVGPAFFLPFLRASKAADELPERFVDQCHLCHSMLSSPRAAKVVAAACERLATEITRIPPAERPTLGSLSWQACEG